MNLLEEEGVEIINNFYSEDEIESINTAIESIQSFALRQFFKEIPQAIPTVFTAKMNDFLLTRFNEEYFVVKSIYFNKPAESNWFVAYHQDLTISVDKKMDLPGYGPWTVKQNQFAVQPPLEILEDNFTIRIHLDKTDAENGALHVIPGSHLKGIQRSNDETNKNNEANKELICVIEKGGIMLMKPLLMHASGRTTNGLQRRVIHIEFSRATLPAGLAWGEEINYLCSPSSTINYAAS